MKLSRVAIALYVALVFASGVVLGAFVDRLYNASTVISSSKKNPEEWRKKSVAETQARLKLTDEQVAKLNAIMDETRVRVEETRQKMRPAYDEIHRQQTQKIREMLTPDQQIEYEKMHREREERQKQTGTRPPGPGI